MKAQLTRRQKRQIAAAQLHPVAWQLRRWAARRGMIEASASEWLKWLVKRAPDEAKLSDSWPRTPNQLGRLLGEMREGLTLLDVEVSFRRSNGLRVWRVESVEHATARRHWEATKEEREESYRAQRREEKARFREFRDFARQYARKTH